MLIGLFGPMGVGKDTFADSIEGAIKMSLGESLKEEVQELIDCNFSKTKYLSDKEYRKLIEFIDRESINTSNLSVKNKTPDMRKLLQFYGTELKRSEDNDYWVNRLIDKLNKIDLDRNTVFITDVRFPNEAKAIENKGGKLIRIHSNKETILERLKKRDGKLPRPDAFEHPSETAMDGYRSEYYVFINTDTPFNVNLANMLINNISC